MMLNTVITSVFSSKVPQFIYGVDQEENEYILCTTAPQYLIKFNGVIDIEKEEDDDEELGELLTEDYQKVEFHIEVFKFTKSGLTPITYESKVKAVQDIINQAVAFYLELED